MEANVPKNNPCFSKGIYVSTNEVLHCFTDSRLDMNDHFSSCSCY